MANSYREESSEEDYDYSDGGWIQWFCNMEGHEFFVEVEDEYIRDPFNLYGLRGKFVRYSEALEMVLSPESPEEDLLQEEAFLELYQVASDLYGIIHSRFIVSPRGLALVKERFLAGTFGSCPRLLCKKQATLPIGVSEELRISRVKMYCPHCQDVYIPANQRVDLDGAYFGSSLPQMFMLSYPEMVPDKDNVEYVAKVYGFRVYQTRGSKYVNKEPR